MVFCGAVAMDAVARNIDALLFCEEKGAYNHVRLANKFGDRDLLSTFLIYTL
jgi:hypothetical protein